MRVAYMSLNEWKSLGATEQAVEDDAIDRAVPHGGIETGSSWPSDRSAHADRDAGHDGPQARAGAQRGPNEGVNAGRKTIPFARFDAKRRAQGLESLRSYRTEWDEKARAFKTPAAAPEPTT